ncbi:MAG: CopG family transcriptional regulator [Spirochaetes bacterium]|nr:CopG family transcriptional regulator [Spirochaetota bacterium]
MGKKKRVQVAFTESQWQLISSLREEFGDGDADIVRNIVLAWLAEKSLISTNVKQRIVNNSIGDSN